MIMGDPDPWGPIINPLWAAHFNNVEEAWNHAAESSAVPSSGESPISPQLHISGNTKKTKLVLCLCWWILRPGNTHLTAGGENFGGYSPVSHASSRAIVRSSGCCGEVARGSTERVGGTGAP